MRANPPTCEVRQTPGQAPKHHSLSRCFGAVSRCVSRRSRPLTDRLTSRATEIESRTTWRLEVLIALLWRTKTVTFASPEFRTVVLKNQKR